MMGLFSTRKVSFVKLPPYCCAPSIAFFVTSMEPSEVSPRYQFAEFLICAKLNKLYLNYDRINHAKTIYFRNY